MSIDLREKITRLGERCEASVDDTARPNASDFLALLEIVDVMATRIEKLEEDVPVFPPFPMATGILAPTKFNEGDRVLIRVEYERVVTSVESHAGGTDYTYDSPLPKGGRHLQTTLAPSRKKRR